MRRSVADETARGAYVMARLQGWKKLYGDDVAVVFGRARATAFRATMTMCGA